MRHGVLSEDPRPAIHENESKVRCLAGVSFGGMVGSLLAWGVSGYAAGLGEMMMVGVGFVTGSAATLVVGWGGGIGPRHALLAGSVAFGALTLGLFVTGLLTPSTLLLHISTVLPGALIGALAGGALLHPIRRRRNISQPDSSGCPFTPVPDDVVVIRRKVEERMAEEAERRVREQPAPSILREDHSGAPTG